MPFLINVSLALLLSGVTLCSGDVTEAQIESLGDDLFSLDQQNNGATPDQVQFSIQGRTGFSTKEDRASQSFFTYVDPAVLERPTYVALMDLYPYYEMQTGTDDVHTAEKQGKIDSFLNTVMQTAVMKRLIKFFADNGVAHGGTAIDSEESLVKVIKDLWFAPYSRAGGASDSSGFEHVFLGEIKNGISGLHSWPRLYFLEQSGRLDYTGYIYPDPEVLTIQWVLDGSEWKPGGSLFTRTSPEHDLAILTACYLLRRGRKACKYTLFDCTKVQITTFDLFQNNTEFIGTAYPSSAPKDSTCQVEPRPGAAEVPEERDISEGTRVSADVSAALTKYAGLEERLLAKESSMRSVLGCEKPKMIRWIIPNPSQPRLWPQCV